MKTVTIHRYIHELPSEINLRAGAQNTRKDGKPSRPARGPRCGIMVAAAVNDKEYCIGVALAHPGQLKNHNGVVQVVGFDDFDPAIGYHMAMEKAMKNERLPRVCLMPADTHRSKNIQAQYDNFLLQTSKVFKDKTRQA